MKLLLSCVNSSPSLIGYDWDKEEIFWSTNKIKVCGICYDNKDLLISTDDFLIRITPNDLQETRLSGQFNAGLHSVHVINESQIGVIDTGNSRLIVLDKKGKVEKVLNPVAHWGEIPSDAIHLNDFAVTPYGIIASCFDYRPWQKIRDEQEWKTWCEGGYGIILSLTENNNSGFGRVVGCGFNHPHSLKYIDPYLYICSSATGVFHVYEFNSSGFLREKSQHKITGDHFLRGAHNVNGNWFLGGSTNRHGEILSDSIKIYHFDMISGNINEKSLGKKGEIYDILPWKDEIMGPLIKHFS